MKGNLFNTFCTLGIFVFTFIFCHTAIADEPTFYLSPGSNADGDLIWQSAVGGVYAEFDLDNNPDNTVDHLTTDDFIIDVGLAGIPGVADKTNTFTLNREYGTIYGKTLLSYDISYVRYSQITFEFSELVKGFGTWTFDDSNSYRESIRIIVTDGNDEVWQSPILESGNLFSHAIEGFIGVVSSVGIKKIAVENLLEDTLEPFAHAFELDHIQVGGIFVENNPPIANAGLDQSVNEGETVQLDGSESSDLDGDTLTFEWTQLAGPVVSIDITDPMPIFVAPTVEVGGATLTFQLVVNDGEDTSDPAITNVTVKNINTPPVAEAGNDQAVAEGSTVQLDGTDSYDDDGEELTYDWIQISGTSVVLSDPTDPAPFFFAPPVGIGGETLTFSLIVSDGIDTSIEDLVNVTVENVNHAPTADAGDTQTVDELSIVHLDGTSSNDPDGDPLTYLWIQKDGPSVLLSDPFSSTPDFTAPEVSNGEILNLVFQLTVNDLYGGEDSDSVTIAVRDINAPPDCTLAHPSKEYLWPPNHKMVSVAILGITDPDDDDVTITITSVTQDEPINGLGDGDTSPDAVIQGDKVLLRSERSGLGNGRVYRIDFTAVDGAGSSCSGYVTVFVPHNKKKPIEAIDDGQLYDSTQE